MSNLGTVVEGIVTPEGTLELKSRLTLPAGRVQVTVQPIPDPPQPQRFWKMMESIWSELRSSGRPSPTRADIDAEINALREEAEEEMQAIEKLHEECASPPKLAKGNSDSGA